MRRALTLLVLLLALGTGLKASTLRHHRLYAAAQAPTTTTWPDDEFATMGLDINFDNLPSGDDYNYQCNLIANGSSGTKDNESCTFKVTWVAHGPPYQSQSSQRIDFATGNNQHAGGVNITDPADFKVKYYVGGQACSGWLDQPYEFTMTIDNACLDALTSDGTYDVSLDIQSGANHDRTEFIFWSSELLLFRNDGHPITTMAPMIPKGNVYLRYIDQGGVVTGTANGSRVIYRDPSLLTPTAHPAREDGMGIPWSTAVVPVGTTDLYQEECFPHTDLFHSIPFVWKYGPEYPTEVANLQYFFQMIAKLSEEHDTLYYGSGNNLSHNDLPIRDGARGQWWGTSYIGGFVSSSGNFYFVEMGGAFREMHRDCSVETLGGWYLNPTEIPIQMEVVGASNHLAHKQVIHDNMNFAGDFQEGSVAAPFEGMHSPMDVAMDPDDDEVFYIPAYHDNVIWRAEEGAGAGGTTKFTVWVGSTSRTGGFSDSSGSGASEGHSALLHGPTSMDYDPVNNCWYVADQLNHRIRKITKNASGGAHVTTVLGDGDPWAGIESDLTLDGTIDVTSGSAAVVGHSTHFTTQLMQYSEFNYGARVMVLSVTDDTHLTLTANAPSTATGVAYGRYGASLANGAPGTFDTLVQTNMQLQTGNKRYLVSPTDAANGKYPDVMYPMTVRVTSTGDLCVLDEADASIRCIDLATNVTRYISSLGEAMQGNGRTVNRYAWRYMALDRWGNSGPLDGIYYGGFQVSICEYNYLLNRESHTNEAYCWARTDSTRYVRSATANTDMGQFFVSDDAGPDGWGKITQTDAPHYYWLTAVDPNGGLYMAGGGEHGVTRVRPRQSWDLYPSSTLGYHSGKLNWKMGGCSTCLSLEMQYGAEGHSVIGLPDLWDYADVRLTISDSALIAVFGLDEAGIDAEHSGDSVKADLLQFMRDNMGPEMPETGEPTAQTQRLRLVRVGRGNQPQDRRR